MLHNVVPLQHVFIFMTKSGGNNVLFFVLIKMTFTAVWYHAWLLLSLFHFILPQLYTAGSLTPRWTCSGLFCAIVLYHFSATGRTVTVTDVFCIVLNPRSNFPKSSSSRAAILVKEKHDRRGTLRAQEVEPTCARARSLPAGWKIFRWG